MSDKKYVWVVVQYQPEEHYEWTPFCAFDNKDAAVKTCRSYNKKYATPQLLDENYDFCDDGSWDWSGSEIVYDVMRFELESEADEE